MGGILVQVAEVWSIVADAELSMDLDSEEGQKMVVVSMYCASQTRDSEGLRYQFVARVLVTA